ncbi:hypothetical protein GobsT_34370 [Gemmata obscuriglobus]|uniref:DUF1501 domain-containing protein n=1 Tax=Gemmata obscuriglobus TaxID=114 RepID=A0A2Z3H260_9BACT|nr:DUF1501 domain-containing protein [Gemmata obscuriglobus]AWM38422.1 DUF1501 domain-containing protein [Gemmata obscuriglobus]QEG28654.1 hypothetical protein GobsT_34370 [Gemmata obscuriglobus]VTS06864.1 hypothetical protein : Uncharacterized protein OS=Singulisphaera acidiphila (strain ATCC BAA-1392 / DSM 18658 / VKM B-2454 / MOB10) GN=Sinac_2308 PE=4 SV=1: DUF1501 [Gemmata obscuriglobus UQM 2246]
MPRAPHSPGPFTLSRRDWLRIGVPAALGFSAPPAGAKPAAAAAGFGRAKSVVVVFTSGGQSQLDTWDPKPHAPEEVRGTFRSIQTANPELRVCEHLPRMAALADRYAIVRSMTHDDLDHGSACYLALTGQFHPRKSSNPPPRPTDFPALGAVFKRLRPAVAFPHTAVHVNGPLLAPIEVAPGQSGGFLGRGYEPAELGNVTDTDRLVESLNLPADVPAERLQARHDLLARLDPGTRADPLARKAFELVNAPQVRTALDLDREPEKLRDRYGRHRSGQACLMARRLVEAGVPWITVFFNHGIRGQDDHPDDTDAYGWDTHNDIFDSLRAHLLPRFDASVSTFLEDLRTRGLLETTLVVVMGEFGRAPRVALEKNFAGSSPGRKHWGACYSVLLAGAGVTPGALVGKSDRIAAYPQSDPTAPGDLAATMFHALGVPPDAHYTDANDRPYRAVAGQPISRLFG